MAFKHFTIWVFIRCLLLMVIACVTAYLAFRSNHYYSASITFLVFVGQVWELTWFVSRTNREVQRFIDSITFEDFTITFPRRGTGNKFGRLYKAFNTFIENQKREHAQREAHLHLINTMINQISTGVFVASEKGEVSLMNTAAVETLGLPKFQNLAKFREKIPDLFDWTDEKVGRNKKLVTIASEEEFKTLSVYFTSLKIRGEVFRIWSFQDIKEELGEKELEAWNKLISILTHEIMNSVTPILSLSESVINLLEKDGEPVSQKEIDEETLQDVHTALQTINKRSNGLLKFVHDYRRLTKIPVPEIIAVSCQELLSSLVRLMEGQFNERDIEVETFVPNPKLSVLADEKMLEQVLINLLHNSCDAVKTSDRKRIKISAYQEEQNKVLEVADSGSGISKEVLEKIFVPFFTTKPNGSGIGLSLSKQMVNAMGGTLKISSKENTGTVVKLIFTR